MISGIVTAYIPDYIRMRINHHVIVTKRKTTQYLKNNVSYLPPHYRNNPDSE